MFNRKRKELKPSTRTFYLSILLAVIIGIGAAIGSLPGALLTAGVIGILMSCKPIYMPRRFDKGGIYFGTHEIDPENTDHKDYAPPANPLALPGFWPVFEALASAALITLAFLLD